MIIHIDNNKIACYYPKYLGKVELATRTVKRMTEKIKVPYEGFVPRNWGVIVAGGLLGVPILAGALEIRDQQRERSERHPIEYAGHLLRECAPEIANVPFIDVSVNQDPSVRQAFIVGRVIDRQLSGGSDPVHDFTGDELARATRILRDRLKLERVFNSDNADETSELLESVTQQFEESCASERAK